jgi:hypothetical protein
MKDIANHTKHHPRENLDKNVQLMSNLNGQNRAMREGWQTPRQVMEEWGFTMDTEPAVVDGLQLVNPPIVFQGNREVPIGKNYDINYKNKVFQSPALSNWGIIYVSSDGKKVDETINAMKKSFGTFGV